MSSQDFQHAIACDIIFKSPVLRIVLDTDVLVAAFRSARGASRQLLLGSLRARFELLLSVPLAMEYEAVLTRTEHLEVCGLAPDEVTQVLDALIKVSSWVPLRFLWRPLLSDPNDEMVLETAVNGGADWLVSFNTRHFEPAAKQFGIRVLRPRDAWKEMKSHEKE